MLLLPLSGWALVSAKPPAGSPGAAWALAHPKEGPLKPGTPAQRPRPPTMVWGVVTLPLLAPIAEIGRIPDRVPEQRALRDGLETTHLLSAWMMLALLVLHVGGALKHQLIDRQPELARMSVKREGPPQ